MLDDLKYIHDKDAQDALGIVGKQWEQLTYDFAAHGAGQPTGPVKTVVLAGMGGSALAADIAASWPGLTVPYEVVRNYSIPGYVNKDTLFIASSYSGNTEETLAALEEAETKKAQIVIVCSGGVLADIAAKKKYPVYLIPDHLQPRMAVFYNLAALVQLYEACQVVEKGSVAQLRAAAGWLKEQNHSWLPEIAAKKNQAKQLAQELMGSSVVIYASHLFYPVAYKWKINCNENAKTVAWCNQFPEFNHNEFLGWTSHPVHKPYKVIDIRSILDHPQIQKRFEVTERLLSGLRPTPEIVVPEGKTVLEQILWTITLGDYVSLYLALLNGLNPSPVDLIEKFKTALH